jgi:hypothetical protein
MSFLEVTRMQVSNNALVILNRRCTRCEDRYPSIQYAMDIGLTENGGRSRLEDDDDCSGLTSAFTGEDLWPGEGESDESDIDDEELSRRLLPLRKARLRPVVLLEVSDIESMRGSEAPGLEEVRNQPYYLLASL